MQQTFIQCIAFIVHRTTHFTQLYLSTIVYIAHNCWRLKCLLNVSNRLVYEYCQNVAQCCTACGKRDSLYVFLMWAQSIANYLLQSTYIVASLYSLGFPFCVFPAFSRVAFSTPAILCVVPHFHVSLSQFQRARRNNATMIISIHHSANNTKSVISNCILVTVCWTLIFILLFSNISTILSL